jgi:hypothetical protein
MKNCPQSFRKPEGFRAEAYGADIFAIFPLLVIISGLLKTGQRNNK